MSSKIIKSFKIDTTNIRASGEDRYFTVVGDDGAVFTIEVLNEDGHYYDFYNKIFSATRASLEKQTIYNGYYTNSISFPRVTDDDQYKILLYAEPTYNTKHTVYKEKRDLNLVIDVNKSTGSTSLMLTKVIDQFLDVKLTLTAISISSATAFSGMSLANTEIDLVSLKPGKKTPFTIVGTLGATRNVSIDRQPSKNDIAAFTERTIGSAAIPIQGEDVSSSTYYKWPIDNIVGLKEGMKALGSNVTASTNIRSYYSDFVTEYRPPDTTTPRQQTTSVKTRTPRSSLYSVNPVTEQPSNLRTVIGSRSMVSSRSNIKETPREDFVTQDVVRQTYYEVYEEALQRTGTITYTNGIPTSAAGNIVFSQKQVDALKDDSIKILGYGVQNIKSLSNYDLDFTDLKVEITPVTTTTTASTIGASSTSVQITERAGIRDGNFSTVTGIGIDTSSAIPTVDSGAGAVNGAGTIVLSAAQELEDGITLTFGNASRIFTITGNVEIKQAGLSDQTIRFDVDKFLTAE